MALLCLAGAATVPAVGDQQTKETPPTTVAVGSDGDRLWPYTSRARSFESRTLVLNVIVMADPKTVERRLDSRAGRNWTTSSRTTLLPDTDGPFEPERVDSPWRSAHGSVRYTYAETGKAGDGEWLKQRYQLHVGTYLGTRHHIRAFAPSERSSWTALQAHSEYWDWFRLRHTVTDVRGTADLLEADFQSMNETAVDRRYSRDSGPLSEGIVVVAGLVPILVGRRRWERVVSGLESSVNRSKLLAVFAIAFTTPLAVRIAGITLERLVPLVTPKLFVVLLYPLLAVGLPVAVARRGASLPWWSAAPAAAAGLALGFAAEFALFGIDPPTRIVGHRLLVATALGLLAAGRGRWRSPVTVAGVALWLWGLGAPLFGAL